MYQGALFLGLALLGMLLLASSIHGNTGALLCAVASPSHVTGV